MSADERSRSDQGFSLVELAIYIFVVGILSAIVAATILSLFRSEKTVSSLTNSASQSQVLVSVLNQDMRSARAFVVRDSGNTVKAEVASKTDPGVWGCVTWAVQGTGIDRTITRNGKVILDSARANGTSPFFSTSADVPQGSGGTLTYDFRAATSDSGIVDVIGTVSNQAQGDSALPPGCAV